MRSAVPMVKVALVGPKTQLRPTIETLHELRLLHVQDFAPGDDEAFDLGSPLEDGNVVAERLLRLRGVLKSAQFTPPEGARPFTEKNLHALEERLREVEDELARLVERRSQTMDALKAVDEEEGLLRRVKNLPIPLHRLTGYRRLAVATAFVPADADLGALRQADPDVEVLESQEEAGRFVAVFARKARERQVLERLAALRSTPVELPDHPGTVADRLAELDGERREATGRLAEVEAKIGAIQERHAAALFALDEALAIQADKATAPVRFRTTAHSFMIEGWVPQARFDDLARASAQATGEKVYLTRLEMPAGHGAHGHESEGHATQEVAGSEDEEPPVKLYNKGRSGPYEVITDTYSRPNYREVDPTLLIYVAFPFFYGFMLGDFGYAIVLFAFIKFGLFTKIFQFFGFESVPHLNRILFHCAAWTFAFGIIYAEFFGFELFGHHGVLWGDETHAGYFGTSADMPAFLAAIHALGYPVLRFEQVPLLLLTTIAIGVIHMLVGLFIGFRNALVSHGLKDAFTHRGSWLGILLGIVVLALGLSLGQASAWGTVGFWGGLGLLAVGLVLLVIGEGPLGLMEVPTLVSNLLSYTRLVAIGLSSAGIALATNEVAKLLISGGGAVGIASAVLIMLFVHLGLNIALGVIGPCLHSLRLHYVEFFTKFYEGGGTPYTPFGFERRYTTKEVSTA